MLKIFHTWEGMRLSFWESIRRDKLDSNIEDSEQKQLNFQWHYHNVSEVIVTRG